MKPIRILIAEDKILIAEQISSALQQYGYEIAGSTPDGDEAVKLAEAEKPDLIIMDINLAGKTDGIEAAGKIMQQSAVPIIYLTDFDDNETIERAKRTHPAAYLLKPFKATELRISIELALYNASNKTEARPGKNQPVESSMMMLNDRVFIRKNESFMRVDISDILLIKADRSYCEIRTLTDKFTQSESMSAVEEKIKHPMLIRVHRSYIVNLDHITAIRGNMLIVNKVKEPIPIGDSYKTEVLRLFNKV